MGNHLFGADIAGELLRSFTEAGVPSMVLVSRSTGDENAGHLAAGPDQVETKYPCSGIPEMSSWSRVDGTIVARGNFRVIILGDSLPAGVRPKPEDSIVTDADTLHVIYVDSDPDAATYTCLCRGNG